MFLLFPGCGQQICLKRVAASQDEEAHCEIAVARRLHGAARHPPQKKQKT